MIPAPNPKGLTAISTVTATISAMPAARRNATNMRGSAAGITILATHAGKLRRSARHLDQARFDAADCGAGQQQHRPCASEGDNGDFQATAKAQRNQCDRNERNRGNRTRQFGRDLHQAVE